MTPPGRARPPILRLAAAAALVVASNAGAAGVQAQPDADAPVIGGPIPFADTVDALRALADAERARPVPQRATDLLARLDPSLAREGAGVGAVTEGAAETLDDALPRLGEGVGEAFAPMLPDADAAADPLLGADAGSLVIAGRASLERGDLDRAGAQFEAALEIAPRAPDAWLGLGDVRDRAGLAAQARLAYQRAIACGDRTPRAMLTVALAELRSGSGERAMTVLAGLARTEGWGSLGRPGRAVAWAALGEAMLDAGLLAAGAEAIDHALELAPNPDPGSAWSREAAGVVRRQQELAGRAREARRTLGDAGPIREDAGAAPGGPRGVGVSAFELLLGGRPAGAGLALIEAIVETEGRVTDEHLVLLGAIAAFEDHALSGRVREGLGALGDVYRPQDPRVLARLRRGEAVVLGARGGALVAREWLKADPSPELVRTLIWSARATPDDPGPLWRDLSAVAAAYPLLSSDVVAALAELGVPLGEVSDALDTLIAEGVPGSSLLANALDRARGLADRREADEPFARLALNADRWQRGPGGGRWIGAVAEAPDPEDDTDRRWLARAFVEVRDPARAADLLGVVVDAPGFADRPASERVAVLVEGAEASAQSGRAEAARDLLVRAATISPSDERVASGLLSLGLRGTPGVEPGEVLRRLRAANPSSTLLARLAAQDLVRKGLVADGMAQLAGLAVVPPDRVLPDAGIWAAMAEAAPLEPPAPGARAVSRAEGIASGWLGRWRERAPEHVELFAQWASVVALDGVTGSEAEIAEAVGRAVPHPRVQSAVVGVLAWTQPDRETAYGRLLVSRTLGVEPDAVRADRLGAWRGNAPDVRGALEVVLALLQSGRTEAAAEVLTWLPASGPYSVEERARLGAFLGLATLGDENATDPAVHELFDAVERLGVAWSVELHEIRIRGLVAIGASPARLLDAALYVPAGMQGGTPGVDFAARLVFERDPSRLDAFMRRVAAWVEAGAPGDAGAPGGRRLSPGAGVLWLVSGADTPDAGVLDRAWEAIVRLGSPDDLLEAGGLETDRLDGTPERVHAELAYQIASQLVGNGSEDLGETFYRRCLALDPGHPWAANDYGYMLLERGGELAEADRLISVAAAALPDNANVLDSLGWVRYAQGIFRDRPASEGGPGVEGAVTLLLRAVRTDGGESNPVIIDHLGDAYWQIGERGEAVRSWREAADVARNQLILENQRQRLSPSVIRTISAVRDRAREKIAEASRDGGEPAVAPVQRPAP